MAALLDAVGVCKVYGRDRLRREAVSEVDVAINPEEAVALMGPSGCGKSTLLGILGLMIQPTAGRLVVNGAEVDGDERRRAALRNTFFGYVHQDFAIVEADTVEQNVMIPLEYATPRVRRPERRARSRAAVEQVGLGWALRKKAAELSGGERQRVAIARSLVNEPRLVLADEPTAALDSATAHEIVTMLLAIRDRGASVLLATHDPRVAERCDRVIRMDDSRIVVGHSQDSDRDAADAVRTRMDWGSSW